MSDNLARRSNTEIVELRRQDGLDILRIRTHDDTLSKHLKLGGITIRLLKLHLPKLAVPGFSSAFAHSLDNKGGDTIPVFLRILHHPPSVSDTYEIPRLSMVFQAISHAFASIHTYPMTTSRNSLRVLPNDESSYSAGSSRTQSSGHRPPKCWPAAPAAIEVSFLSTCCRVEVSPVVFFVKGDSSD